ncbi:MAG: hypothetical protein U0527_09475 [Candidatus Eisenbacteria bacterium]
MNAAARLLFANVSCFALLAMAACKKDGGVIEPQVDDGYLPATSPANLLENLKKAYQERTLDKYAALFDSDTFAFEFSQLDRESDPSLPMHLSFTEDQQSTKTMMEDAALTRIVLRFATEEKVAAAPADNLPGGPDGVWKVTANAVHLEVHTQNDNGEPLVYLIDGDSADIFLREYPEAPINGAPSWKIVYWRDRPIGDGARAPVRATWGGIKALYS